MSSKITVSGIHVIEQLLLHHPNTLEGIAYCDSKRGSSAFSHLLKKAAAQNIPINGYPKVQFNQLAKNTPDASLIAFTKLPAMTPLKQLLDAPHDYPFIVILDHIEDAFNFGAIIRTCESLGVSAIVFAKDRQAPLTSGVIKASSGAVFHLPLVQVTNIAQAAGQLKKKAYWIYGANEKTDCPIETFDPASPAALVMGNEHHGISKRVSALVDQFLSISTPGKTPSLNVSVATAIMVHTLVRKSS